MNCSFLHIRVLFFFFYLTFICMFLLNSIDYVLSTELVSECLSCCTEDSDDAMSKVQMRPRYFFC